MAWQCRLIERPELDDHGNVDVRQRALGDMWFLDLPEEQLRNRQLTAYYWANNSGRKPIVVLLPGRNYFLVDGQGFSAERGYYDCWEVMGVPPAITVAPSINMVGRYHGWLKAGVISDDCDGRKFLE